MIDALWTAGWDSTFRVTDLVAHGEVVQPWYVISPTRRSTRYELATQDTIRAAIERLDFGGSLLPTRLVHEDEIPADDEISNQYKRLFAGGYLGRQYEWLARLAKSEETVLELSIHRDDVAHELLQKDVEMLRDNTYALVANPSDPDLKMFRYFRFPLFELTKLDMQRLATDGGFSEILELTWFCFHPLRGKPCGFCRPCQFTRNEGLGRRVPPVTFWRRVLARLNEAGWTLPRRVTRRLGRAARERRRANTPR